MRYNEWGVCFVAVCGKLPFSGGLGTRKAMNDLKSPAVGNDT